MPNFMRTKEDIEFHSDGFRDSKPAVNVKVYDTLSSGYTKWRKDNPDEDPRFTEEWIEENISDDLGNNIFWSMCELRWEDLETEAREIWGTRRWVTEKYGTKYSVNVYSEGRSGGWAVVDGIDTDVDSWDAIEFSKWKRFAKYARAVADGIMYDVIDSIYYNYFIDWSEEESELQAPAIPEGIV